MINFSQYRKSTGKEADRKVVKADQEKMTLMPAERCAHIWQVSCEAVSLPSFCKNPLSSAESSQAGSGPVSERSWTSAGACPSCLPGGIQMPSHLKRLSLNLFRSVFPNTSVVACTQPLERGRGRSLSTLLQFDAQCKWKTNKIFQSWGKEECYPFSVDSKHTCQFSQSEKRRHFQHVTTDPVTYKG